MPCPPSPPNFHYGLMAGPDIRVTWSQPSQSRSESTVAVNPTNTRNLICASKKFIAPELYHATISTSFSTDGGATWTESEPALNPGWQGMTDPDLTFDHLGNAYLIVEPVTFVGPNYITIGMYVYKSSDGGVSWQPPVMLHTADDDDKQWMEADTNPASPYRGRVYAVWSGGGTPLRFARSSDQGATWQGVGASLSGSDVFPESSFAPSLAIGRDGTVHVTWQVTGTADVRYIRSTDGGETFSSPVTVVTGVHDLSGSLPETAGFPHFPTATFRVLTLLTSCVADNDRLVVAWADFREGRSRIYYRVGGAGGTAWEGPAEGSPLLPFYGRDAVQHFHPQLSVAVNGAVACAFYELGPKPAAQLIDVIACFSCDDGAGFGGPIAVTDRPWDPAVNAPWSHGDPDITFIGEYFGFSGAEYRFATIWTDTRTGVQELFFDRVLIQLEQTPIALPLTTGIVAGVKNLVAALVKAVASLLSGRRPR